MFIVFENAHARSIQLWDFELPDVLARKISVHGWFPSFVLSRDGLSRAHYYLKMPRFGTADRYSADLPLPRTVHTFV